MKCRRAPIVVQTLAVLFMAPPAAVQAESLREQHGRPLECNTENRDYVGFNGTRIFRGLSFCVDDRGQVTRANGRESVRVGVLGQKWLRQTAYRAELVELHEEDGKLVQYICQATGFRLDSMKCRYRPDRSVIGVK